MSETPKKILVVEDDPIVLHTLLLILEQNSYEVKGAKDPSHALTIGPAFQPDILFCDINLPGMNGIQVAIRLQKSLPKCRVVLFSGEMSSADLLDEARRQGYDFEVLAKPTDPNELLRVLSEKPATPRAPTKSGIHRVK